MTKKQERKKKKQLQKDASDQKMLKVASSKEGLEFVNEQSEYSSIQPALNFDEEVQKRVGMIEELQITFKKLEEEENSNHSKTMDRKGTNRYERKEPSTGREDKSQKSSNKYQKSISSVQEKMRLKIKTKVNKQIQELVEVFDQMYD